MKKQDEEFYREIYHLYDKDVRSFLKHYFPGIGQEDTGEIIKDVWAQFGLEISAARKRTYRENLSWLFAVTRNKSMEWVRENARYHQGKENEASVTTQKSKGGLPEDGEERMTAESILQELSKEEKIFSGNEFCGPESGWRQEHGENCKLFQLRRKLEKKMREAEFLPWRES